MIDVESRALEFRTWYEAAQWRYRAFEGAVVAHLRKCLAAADLGSLQVESRTKSLESYLAKAMQPDPVSPGAFKYTNPRTEITDTVGVRIIVPLSTDVAPVRALLHERYAVEEEAARGADEGLEVPGYQSLHLLVRVREEDQQDPEFRDLDDMVLEVQVRTILQHAWASLQHDLLYKTDRPPAPSLKRRLVALAGMLELADREFVQVRHEHGAPVESSPGLAAAARSGAVSPATVQLMVEDVVGDTGGTDQIWFEQLHAVLGELGLIDRQSVIASMESWVPRAGEVASAVTASRPFANAAYVFDQLLRLGLGDAYFERRLRRAEVPNEGEARRTFMAERSALLVALEASR